VGNLFYTGFLGDLRLFYLSFTSGLSFFRLLNLSGLGRTTRAMTDLPVRHHQSPVFLGQHGEPFTVDELVRTRIDKTDDCWTVVVVVIETNSMTVQWVDTVGRQVRSLLSRCTTRVPTVNTATVLPDSVGGPAGGQPVNRGNGQRRNPRNMTGSSTTSRRSS
jgi:hypothetical protein